MNPFISTEELQKIEQLLESKEAINLELALTLLSSFALDEEGANWLWQYYQQLIESKKINKTTWSFEQLYTTGTLDNQPTKASYILTILLEQAPYPIQSKIIQSFIHNKTLTLPRNELETLPAIIFTFPTIEYLTFPSGNLKNITADIEKLQTLKIIDVRHQPLTFIHPNIGLLPKLEELWVRNAAFISDDVREIPQLDIYVEGAY